ARLQRARILDDKPALWALIHEHKDDDTALESARLVSPMATTSKEKIEVADTFVAHRQFDYALPLYQEASRDSAVAADSRYEIARIQFLREDFNGALETYRGIVRDFAGTNWEKDSLYQIASCHWRLGDYKSAEQAYLKYISRYGNAGDEG